VLTAPGGQALRGAVAILALAVVAILAQTSADAGGKRSCHGNRATIVGPNTNLHAKGNRRVIVGTSHRDVIVGTGRSEWIVGARGRDVICAGGGRDFVFVGDENRHEEPTKLDGGADGDYIAGSFAGDLIKGGGGDDKIDGQFDGDQIIGGSGNDFVRAQAGADRIRLGEGDDHAEASSGRDVVHGGPGSDDISTGPNQDAAFGEEGNDFLHLLWGNDRGFGGPGRDEIGGGPGNDFCKGGDGVDRMTGCEVTRHSHGDQRVAELPKFEAPTYRYSAHLPSPDGRKRLRMRPFSREPAFQRLSQFLDKLQQTDANDSSDDTKRQLERSAELTKRVGKVVDRRHDRRLRHSGRIRAVFSQSVERYSFRLVTAAISDEIDRLRWTGPN
jgi:Ca2+-binding RTX toxin-like protein